MLKMIMVFVRVYDDVPPALQRLIRDGVKIYTYSSGSIGAQKLLFGYSTHGNLLEVCSCKVLQRAQSKFFQAVLGGKFLKPAMGKLMQTTKEKFMQHT